jgi:hypothetical protein
MKSRLDVSQDLKVVQNAQVSPVTIKEYEEWEGLHKFFWDGRLMLGPKWGWLAISFSMLNVPSIYYYSSPIPVRIRF